MDAGQVIPAEAARHDNLFEAMGGTATCRAISEAFYAGVARDPALRPLFPGKTFTCAIEAFTAFLVQFLGGPAEAAQRRQGLSLRESHLRIAIGPREQEAWLRQMDRALDVVPMDEPSRRALRAFFACSSAYLVNQDPALPDGTCSSPAPLHGIDGELAGRWQAQCALDEAVAAVREGDAARALALARGPLLRARFRRDRALYAGLLAVMVASGHAAMLGYVQAALEADPALAHERYNGRTLLHQAAAAGCSRTVALLLRLGADPNCLDLSGHAPLYWLANARKVAAGEQVVHMLVAAGADLDAAAGVTRCTALHMAARQGNVAVARALLRCGAASEARDYRGDTPLRRAIKCRRAEVAALLDACC